MAHARAKATSPVISSALADQLGIQHPILLAGMAVVSSARLAAAVSNAGGLGVVGAGFPSPSPAKLRKMLDELSECHGATANRGGMAFIACTHYIMHATPHS